MKLSCENINENVIFINEHSSVRDLIGKFKNKKKIVALCLNKKKVIGIVTIGDLRRSIEKNNNFNLSISKIYNRSFFYVYKDTPLYEINYKLYEFKKKK